MGSLDRVPARLRRASLLAVLAAAAAASEAQPAVKQVLVLQSFNRGNLAIDQFTAGFRVGLDQNVGQPVNVVQIAVGPTGAVGAPEEAIVDYIQATFRDHPPPDLIVTVAGPAAQFARKHRQRLFPGTPLLLAAVDERWLGHAPLEENDSAVAVSNDFSLLVGDILQVLPETRQVVMVTGSGAVGRFWRERLEVEFARFQGRLTFVWSDDLSLSGLLQRCSALPSRSAIIYLNFGADVQGGTYPDERVLPELSARASAPVFGLHSSHIGHGIVGGARMSIEDLAAAAAGAAGRMLDGIPPARLRPAPQSPGPPIFDWRELRRWGIPESRLPPGSVVRFRAPSLWDEYRLAVLTAVGVLVLQSLLISWLFYERRERRRAEIDSRRNLSLAADANRRETISALTASIGHELAQPLAAIVHNARAFQMRVGADGTPPDPRDEIVADIEAEAGLATRIVERHRTMLRSRQLDKKPIDIRSVIDESLALLAHEMAARQVETAVDLSSAPCVVEGDPVLLQQVLVNLLKNAIEALAETPLALRRIAIRSVVGAGGVEISVCDSGPGLPPEVMATLFTPFVTTKSQGLGIGLTITRTIVEAHGGTIGARENHDGGATFTVTLPQGAAPRLPAGQLEAAGGR